MRALGDKLIQDVASPHPNLLPEGEGIGVFPRRIPVFGLRVRARSGQGCRYVGTRPVQLFIDTFRIFFCGNRGFPSG